MRAARTLLALFTKRGDSRNSVVAPRPLLAKKKAAWSRPLESLEVHSIQGLPPGQGQASRRSDRIQYPGRQAADGVGTIHQASQSRACNGTFDRARHARDDRHAGEEQSGCGEDDGLTHVRWP